MTASLKIDAAPGQWFRARNQWERIIAKASTAAMRGALRDSVQAGRKEIASGGFGPKFQRTLVGKMLSGSKQVLNPKAWVHSTANFADVFETGKTITGNLLWLPLPNVPQWPGADPPRQLSPRKFVQLTGHKLFTIRRPGHKPLLAAKGTFAGRTALTRSLFRGRPRRLGREREQIIPLFVGVPSVTIPKKFNVHDAIDAVFDDSMQRHYVENLEKYEGR